MRMSRAKLVISWKPSHNSEARSVHDELDPSPYPPLRGERMKCQRSVRLEQANRVRDALFFESLRACGLGAIAKIWMRGRRAHVNNPHRCGVSPSPPRTDSPW